MYMWTPTSHFLPTKQLTADKRDQLSDSENYYLISDHYHTSEGGLVIQLAALINLALTIITASLIFYYLI